MSPQRIQRKRTKGWRMPQGAVYVGRPSRWGNPYVVGAPQTGAPPITAEDAVEGYRYWIANRPELLAFLRGRDLVCWCPLEDADGNRVPCHADVLLELANS